MIEKVCVVTGSRAEFGLLEPLMLEIDANSFLKLQVIATGMHLSNQFGLTIRDIESAGFTVDAHVNSLIGDNSRSGVTKSMGIGLIGFADAYEQLKPDLIIVLGDRFEIFAAATAALIHNIPIGHIHGGEVTEGAFDDALRHSITKMSSLHFVANPEYRRRVIQLGEKPSTVFTVGGMGVDALQNLDLLDKKSLEKSMKFEFGKKNLLITYHPETAGENLGTEDLDSLLAVLDERETTHLIFTAPNADPGSDEILARLESYCSKRGNARIYKSLGQLRYLSCMKFVDGVVGNSSSGLIEAPSIGVGTVNIGSRQQGRLRAASIIQAEPDEASIRESIDRLYEESFKCEVAKLRNPYGKGGASRKIVRLLQNLEGAGLKKKSFYDYPAIRGI